jgi:hypothetical protein
MPAPKKTNGNKKRLSAKDMKAIDWQTLLAKLPQFAALIMQIIQLVTSDGPKGAAAGGTEGLTCCQEVKDANDADLELLAQYIVSRMQLCDAICCCEDDGE